MKIEIHGFICAPEGIINHLGLTSAALWACIYALPEKNPEEPGIKHIAQYTIGLWTGLTRETVGLNLPMLLEAGYLTCEDKRPGLTSGYRITKKINLFAIAEARKTEIKFRIGNFIPIFRYLTDDCHFTLNEAAVYGALYRNGDNRMFARCGLTAPEISKYLCLSNSTINRVIRKLTYYQIVEEVRMKYDRMKYYIVKKQEQNSDKETDEYALE